METTVKVNDLSKSVIISCFLAGCLEIYDFTIFGILAAKLHKEYLGFLTHSAGVIVAYALFAVGFVFRPLGSIIFGYIGDKYGRKKSLVLSVSMMGVASFTMFALPTYAKIGMFSCIIIALVRIVQGISVGGEFSGAIIYAIEHTNRKKAGLVGSIIVTGCLCGVLLATMVKNIINLPSMPDYSWRFAFLLGFILSIIGYFIRSKLRETPEFEKCRKLRRNSFATGVKKQMQEHITAIMVSAATGVNLYYGVVYMPRYVNKLTGMDLWYLPIVTITTLAVLVSLFGWLSDKVNRMKLILVGMGLVTIYDFIMLWVLDANSSILLITTIFVMHAVLFAIQDGTMNTFIVEIFPTEYRFRSAAFCYSVGMGIVGGTTPMISEIITENFTNSSFVLSCYIGGISLLGFLAMLKLLHRNHNLIKVNKSPIYPCEQKVLAES